jgi:hypothetical protein
LPGGFTTIELQLTPEEDLLQAPITPVTEAITPKSTIARNIFLRYARWTLE